MMQHSYHMPTQPKRLESIYKFEARDKYGRQSYYVLAVDRLKESLFLHATKTGKFNIRKFGRLIASGYGPIPEEYRNIH